MKEYESEPFDESERVHPRQVFYIPTPYSVPDNFRIRFVAKSDCYKCRGSGFKWSNNGRKVTLCTCIQDSEYMLSRLKEALERKLEEAKRNALEVPSDAAAESEAQPVASDPLPASEGPREGAVSPVSEVRPQPGDWFPAVVE